MNHSSLVHHTGLVIKRFGQHAEVESPHLGHIHCLIQPQVGPVVAGDQVIWNYASDTQGVIHQRLERRSLLTRLDARGQEKPIAANITQLNIILAEEPSVSWLLFDSYLVIAESLNLNVLIILNKLDLASQALKEKLSYYHTVLGYPLFMTTQDHPEEEKKLLHYLNQEVSIFVGQSGVGKSSIIKRLLPEKQSIQTQSLSRSKGQHTTSYTCYYHLPSGGAIIDSPGIREYRLTHLPPDHIAHYFKEFKPFLKHCKFRNCDHETSKHCGIIDAVSHQLISKERYHRYLLLKRSFS